MSSGALPGTWGRRAQDTNQRPGFRVVELDEKSKHGTRTRLLRFDPGVYTTAPFVHDHWEEVYLLSGDLTVGNDAQGKGGESYLSPTYACRPPGVYHGPFKSEKGCMLYEIHYYDESKR